MKKYLYAAVAVVAFSWFQTTIADSGTYQLVVDKKTYDVTYKLDGSIIAMGIDQQSTSLLIGTVDVTDSIFEIEFASEVLSATNGEFIVLVDGLETDYDISYNDGNPKITFPIESGTEEIEIIGTSVIPEFPLGVLAVMGIVTFVALILSRMTLSRF
ncbi:MAG TPA: hypothetical protein VNK44_01715 [Candidatus Nitrosotenuis sp.]|nr:hypothetical protein [Candidatus Nitrosotenuis sp.]